MSTGEELPFGWSSAKVEDLARPDEQPVLTGPFGTSLGSDDFLSDGVPILTIGCLTEYGVSLRKASYISAAKARELERYTLRVGDILFSRMASVGRANIVPSNLYGALFNYHIMRLRLAEDVFLAPLFISYVRGAPAVFKYLDEVNHGATRDGINTTQLLGMPVCVPPLAEQRRIVTKLETLTATSRRAKEALDAIPPLLERFRQSVLAAALRGDLTAEWRAKNPDMEPAENLLARVRVERRRRWEEAELAKMQARKKAPGDGRWREKYEEPEPVDTEGLPELPEGWAWASLAEVTDSARLIRYGILMPGPDYPGGIPYVKVLHMKGDTIETTALPRTSPEMHAQFIGATLAKGDLLLSIRGTYGRVAEVPESLEGANITQDSARIAPLPGISRDYLATALRTPYMQSHFRDIAKGVAVRGLNITDIRRAPIAVAPEAEQRMIAREAARMIVRIARWQEGVKGSQPLLRQLDKSILAKAFRGELVPQDPSDEPASVLLARIRKEREAAGPTGGRGRKKAAPEKAPAKEKRAGAGSPR